MSALTDLLSALERCRTIDLAQPYFTGMPHYPLHAPDLYSLSKKHGAHVNPGGSSSAAEAIALSTHVGTHIDALCHFPANGKLHGGEDPSGLRSYANGLERFSVDTIEPILRRGVLLDIARLQGVDVPPVDFVITPAHLCRALAAAGAGIQPGDVVLLRTGWPRDWNVFAAGSDSAPLKTRGGTASPIRPVALVPDERN